MKRRYTVEWSDSLIGKLAEAWNDNPAIKSEIQAAVDTIDNALAHAPASLGKLLPGSQTRLVVFPPVAILFVIQEFDRKVRVVEFDLWP
jgi:hypothetical protein